MEQIEAMSRTANLFPGRTMVTGSPVLLYALDVCPWKRLFSLFAPFGLPDGHSLPKDPVSDFVRCGTLPWLSPWEGSWLIPNRLT